VALNALRHGLAASVRSDHIISTEVERLAIVLAGENPAPTRLELARIAAKAEMTLVRVRTARVDLVNQAAACTTASRGQNNDRISKRARAADPQPAITADGAPHQEASALLRVLPQLVKLDRLRKASAVPTQACDSILVDDGLEHRSAGVNGEFGPESIERGRRQVK